MVVIGTFGSEFDKFLRVLDSYQDEKFVHFGLTPIVSSFVSIIPI